VAENNQLSLDDIQEIFGSVMKAAEAQAPEKTEAAAPAPPAPAEQDTEDFIRRAREIEKEFAKKTENSNVAAPAGVVLDETEKEAMIKMYEELSSELRLTIMSFTSEKAVNNMMLRSLEKTALAHPVLKNTNWDSDGKLKENGAIDVERLMKNIKQESDGGAEKTAAALMELLAIRFKAVKAAMGAEGLAKAAAAINKKFLIAEAGYPRSVSDLIKGKVTGPAVKKAEN